MPLPSSIRGLVLVAFPLLFSAGCHAWRMERPLPSGEAFLGYQHADRAGTRARGGE